MVVTFSGLGSAVGPVVAGLVAQITGSLQTGLVTICLITGLGVVASAFYPGYARKTAHPIICADGER